MDWKSDVENQKGASLGGGVQAIPTQDDFTLRNQQRVGKNEGGVDGKG